MSESVAPRETVGFEIVIRFFPGSEKEAHDFFLRLGWPDEQAQWLRLDRIVVPEGEARVTEASRGRSIAGAP
jgi:hypothetical protein